MCADRSRAPAPLLTTRPPRPSLFLALQVDPTSLASRASTLLARLLDALSDAAYAAAPDSVSRSTVDTAVRVGAALVLLSALRAAAGLVVSLAVGGLGLALASRLLASSSSSAEGSGGRRSRRRGGGRGGGRRGGDDDDFWGG